MKVALSKAVWLVKNRVCQIKDSGAFIFIQVTCYLGIYLFLTFYFEIIIDS